MDRFFISLMVEALFLLRSFFFSGLLHIHVELILENSELQTNARNSKTIQCTLDSVNGMLFYINVAVEPCK